MEERFNDLLLADPSVVLGQLGDVLPAACPGSSQQAEHETCPMGNLWGQSTSTCESQCIMLEWFPNKFAKKLMSCETKRDKFDVLYT